MFLRKNELCEEILRVFLLSRFGCFGYRRRKRKKCGIKSLRVGMERWVFLLFFVIPSGTIGDDKIYILTHKTLPSYKSGVIELRWMYGTRYAPPQWAEGEELWILSRYTLLKWMSVGGGGGYNIGKRKWGVRVESGFPLWRNKNDSLSVISFGIRETEGVFTAGIGILFSHNFSHLFDLSINTIFEKSFSSLRDFIDWHISLGFSYKITSNFRFGVEYLGEDLEDIWEREEAEGGANNLFGIMFSYSFKGRIGIVLSPLFSAGPRSNVKNNFLFSSRIWMVF